MARRRYKAEQIVAKLRQAEVELSKGQTTAQVCKKVGISEQRYYRWRREYGGLSIVQAKRLKELDGMRARGPIPDIRFERNDMNLVVGISLVREDGSVEEYLEKDDES